MTDATQTGLLGDRAPQSRRRMAEKLFVVSLVSALIAKLFFALGFKGLVEAAGAVGTFASVYLAWILLAVSAAGLAMLIGAGGKGVTFSRSSNRLFVHALSWLVAAGLFLVLTLMGDSAKPMLSFLGKSGGIIVDFCESHGYFLAIALALISGGLATVGTIDSLATRPGRVEQLWVQNISAKIAGVPMAVTAMGVFVGATLWTIYHSFTNSKLLPKSDFIGLDQYERLWSSSNNRWWISIENLAIYGACSLVFSITIGFMLAALLDQKIRFENTFRTIFLYPFALSFIVTGLVWQWILTPEFGVERIVRDLGFDSFRFDPLYNPEIVIYGILIAGLWQGTGLIMCLMLAGLRGIDEDIWKAARVDGIPMWKTYIFIVIPMMRPVFITTIVLIASGIVKVYDLVVAQTSGGPGIASEVPAKYVYDFMFGGQNLGQGFAASTMMLVGVIPIVAIWAFVEFGGRKNNG